MKLIITISTIFLTNLLIGQTFNYQDSTFTIGQTKTLSSFSIGLDCDYVECNSDILDSLMDFLKTHKDLSVEIENHTDTRDYEQNNLELSQKRAERILKYLIEHGIDENRLTATGMGETKPIVSDEDIRKMTNDLDKELAHRQNRRVQVKIVERKKKEKPVHNNK
jgi:hypothetical protein